VLIWSRWGNGLRSDLVVSEIGREMMGYLTVFIDNVKFAYARVRFYKHYLVARRRRVELKSIEGLMRDRLERQFVGKRAPIVDVKMRLLRRWQRLNGIVFDAPIAVIATLDALPAFGMSFEVRGADIRIRQLQGVRGFSTRGRYHPARSWPRLFVEACQDLALMHGYSRVLVIRSHRSYSWKRLDIGYAADTPEGVGQRLEIRSRLIKRLDGTARSMEGFGMERDWWVWRASRGNVSREGGKRQVETSMTTLKTRQAGSKASPTMQP